MTRKRHDDIDGAEMHGASRSGNAGRTGKRGGKSAAPAPDFVYGELPSREVVLRFIADHPQKASKRELYKAFGIKGDDRIALKDMLRDLEDEGMVEKNRKSLVRPGALPPVTVLDITVRGKDGELIARPAEWLDEMGVAPAVAIRQSSNAGRSGRDKAPVAGLGDRVLAKIFPASDRGGPAYTAQVIKVLDKRKNAGMGVFKQLLAAVAACCPSTGAARSWSSIRIIRATRRTAIWSRSKRCALGVTGWRGPRFFPSSARWRRKRRSR